MIALVASFFSLFVGPLVYQTFGPLKRTDKIVSGFVLVVVSGVIMFEVVPELFNEIGYLSFILVLTGFAGPTLIESTFRKAADTTHKLTIYLGLTGLVIHALIDGAAIQSEDIKESHNLTMAILIHRLPIGLTIWWLLKPILGEKAALVMLFFMGISTIGGFFLSQSVGQIADHSITASIQALVSGSLLHVVIYKPHSDGCLHTSDDHHHHHPGVEDKYRHAHSIVNEIRSRFSRYEVFGMTLGLAILLIMQQTTH